MAQFCHDMVVDIDHGVERFLDERLDEALFHLKVPAVILVALEGVNLQLLEFSRISVKQPAAPD